MKSFFEKLTKAPLEGKEEEKEPTAKSPQKKKVVNFQEETALRPDPNRASSDVKAKIRKDNQQEEMPLTISQNEEGQLTVDVYQTDTEIVIKSTIAGVKAEDLDITITSDMVTIRGARLHDENVPKENYFYQECYWGPFSRSIILPQDIVSEKSDASMKEGVLTIRLPKAHVLTTKKLKVKTA